MLSLIAPTPEQKSKGLQVRGAAAEDDVGMANGFDVAEKGVDAKGLKGDVGMANGFDVAEKGVDAKGLKGVDAAVDGEAETAGAGAGAWDVWTSEAAGAGAGAAAAAGFAKGFWNVNKSIAVAAGT
jgi:hypothetical protein